MSVTNLTETALAKNANAGFSGATHNSSITVVITSYNHAQFLPDAIQSVLGQTTPPTEVLVVDDGSTDNTAELVQRYPKVTYIYQQNQGLSAARNTGLRASTGALLVFLDADDVFEPSALEIGLLCLKNHPEWALVSGGHRRVNADLEPIGSDCCWPVHTEHYRYLLHGNYIGMHATVMYRKAALQAVGGFDETLPACEDYDVYLRTARQYPIGSHGEVVAWYRQHGSNMSSRLENMLDTALRVHGAQRPFVEADPVLRGAWKLGQRNWWMYFGDQVLRAPSDQKRLLVRVLVNYPFIWKHLRNTPLRPRNLVRALRQRLKPSRKAPPPVNLGSFRSRVSLGNANDRDSVVARYVRRFLDANHEDVVNALEIGPDKYPLERLAELPDSSQSCVVCVLQLRGFDLDEPVGQMFRVLKPSGVLFAVLPGVALRSHSEASDDHWRFTTISGRMLFSRYFGVDLEVAHYGNPVTSLAALHQLPADSLEDVEFDPADSQQQLLVTVRAPRR